MKPSIRVILWTTLSLLACSQGHAGQREGGGGDYLIEKFITDATALRFRLLKMAKQGENQTIKILAEEYAENFGLLFASNNLQISVVKTLKAERGAVWTQALKCFELHLGDDVGWKIL